MGNAFGIYIFPRVINDSYFLSKDIRFNREWGVVMSRGLLMLSHTRNPGGT